MRRKSVHILFFIFMTVPVFGQICPGTQGSVKWQCWRSLYEGSLTELSAQEFYPDRPDVTQTIYSLDAPINYDNYIGGRIAGYIKVNHTDSVQFNITCNEKGNFYLSTDDDPANLQLVASTPAYTNLTEHDKYPQQTSTRIGLVEDQYYYFEIIYVESSGSDHCRIFWKNSFVGNNNWNIVTAQYIYDVGCQEAPCPARGTGCDDGNANTVDDKEDGHCHCVGKPATTNLCVGERGTLERYRYDNISGSTLNDLYISPNFPGTPQYSAEMKIMGIPSVSGLNNYGHLVSAFISVPVSGLYKFNITGDDQTAVFLSNNDDPVNKQATQAIVLGWTYMTEHNKYVFQNTANIQMEAGQYYYIEINQKQSTSSSHFGLFWQTPFSEPNIWKRIPSFYFYDYDCDIACIPEGTPCDDGNPFTNNDLYNQNCECEGTPCNGEDCDSPLANYIPYDKCGLTEQINNRAESSWLSCEANTNPNPQRDRGHWIMYDLGNRYELISSRIWNYNVITRTHLGFEMVEIDYSEDGNTWTNLGSYNWPLATGENGYGGFNGPDFNNVKARYVLINSLDDTLTCRGLSKVAFQAVLCPLMNTPCNDEDINTANDKYNDNCECQGLNLVLNPCNDENILLQDTILLSDVIGAQISITSGDSVLVNGVAGLVAGSFIELNPGFETLFSSTFMASVAPCDEAGLQEEANTASRNKNPDKESEHLYLYAKQVKDTDYVDIFIRTDGRGHAKLIVKDTESQILYYLMDNELLNKGVYRKRIRTKKISDLTGLSFSYFYNGKKYEAKVTE